MCVPCKIGFSSKIRLTSPYWNVNISAQIAQNSMGKLFSGVDDSSLLKNVTFDYGAFGVKFGIFTFRGQSTVFLENPQADNHWSAKHPQNKAFSPNLKIDSDNIQCSSSTACK
jgi:hypothetical protein